MPNADEILKHKLAGLTDEQRDKLAEMLLAEVDEMVEDDRRDLARFMAAHFEREKERLRKFISKQDGE